MSRLLFNGSMITKNLRRISTINAEEIKKFETVSWWDTNGDCKPLHSMNSLRVPLIRDALLLSKTSTEVESSKLLEGFKILDVGCGGGILSESLARIGANVTGLDACKKNIEIATQHRDSAPDVEFINRNLKYLHSSVEDLMAKEPELKFDAVVSSEVLEHVDSPQAFISSCSSLLKPGGSFVLTTINRTNASWLGAIIGAEYVFKLIPEGTHDWNKFFTPEEVESMLNTCGCRTHLVHGMVYSPINNRWAWSSCTQINYAIHAIKNNTKD